MTGPTHRQYSICFAFLVSILFFRLGITNINYYLAIPILLTTARTGALFPDVDHDWHNVHDKTTINRIINFIIHLTGGKHRSWQTHSIDICAWFTLGAFKIPKYLYSTGSLSQVNFEVLQLLLLGFASGWISHLFSDMLTGEGVRLFCFIKKKVRFVPRKLGPIVFNTGDAWEAFNFKAMRIINTILGIYCILYPFIYNGSLQKLFNNIIK